jgi:hypothetical protein
MRRFPSVTFSQPALGQTEHLTHSADFKRKAYRIKENSGIGCFGFWQITGTGWIGTKLWRGLQSSSPAWILILS